ncbi:MAG: hypothetical protein H0T84_02720 [Tatlockia sp.]|nr:hypothetical protein [Tatlockia sp.]
MDIFNKLFGNQEDTLKDAADAKRKQAEKLLESGKEKLSDAYDVFSETVDEVYSQTKEKAKEVYASGSRVIIGVEEQVKEQLDEVTHFVKEKPVTSLIIGAGIAYLIFSLLKNHSDDN